MIVLIAESNSSGHRYSYVRVLAESALQEHHQVFVLLSDEDDAPEFAEFLAHLDVVFIRAKPADLAVLSKESRRIRSDIVIVPEGDALMNEVARSGRWTGAGTLRLLQMRTQAPHGSRMRRWIKGALKVMVKLRCRLTPGVEVFTLTSPVRNQRQPGRWTVVDPVLIECQPDRRDARRRWGLSEDRLWFSLVGAIAERKNPDLVVRAISKGDVRNAGILLAGRVNNDIRSELMLACASAREAGIEVVEVPKLLSGDELDSALLASDAVVLAHSNEGPSGILAKALAVGTPVLAAGAKSLRRDCERYPESAIWTPLAEEALASGSNRVLQLERIPRPALVDSSGFAKPLLRPRPNGSR